MSLESTTFDIVTDIDGDACLRYNPSSIYTNRDNRDLFSDTNVETASNSDCFVSQGKLSDTTASVVSFLGVCGVAGMHLYHDNQYFQCLVYPRFNIIRWIEFIFCLICLTLAIMAFQYNLHILIKVITISVSAAFVFICFFDVVAWLFRSSIGYAAWLMFSLSGFLFFCLCGGCIMFLKRTTLAYYFYAMGFLFLVTSIIFFFDYIWMVLEYINLRRCRKSSTTTTPSASPKLNRGTTCCLCKYEIQPCHRGRSPENLRPTSQRSFRKIMYPSSNVACTRHITPGQRKSHKCGVCPRRNEHIHSAPSNYASTPQTTSVNVEVTKKKPRSPQTLPQIPITTPDANIQEEEYQLPFFKSNISDYPGPPYYLCNILEKRNNPSKYYSNLEPVAERESGETSSRGGSSEMVNDTACSSTETVESFKSYQTSAASSIKKLFQSNAVLYDYQDTPSMEKVKEMRHNCNDLSEMGRNVHSVEIKRSIETIEIKRNVDLPEFRTMRKIDDANEGTNSYLYSGSTNENIPRKKQQMPTSTVQYHMENFKSSSFPSKIPIRPESRSVLKIPPYGHSDKRVLNKNIQVTKKPLSSSRLVNRLRIRPESKISPCMEDETNTSIKHSSTSPEKVRIPWFKNVSKSNTKDSPRKNQQHHTRSSQPKSLTRPNSTMQKMVAESSDSFPSSRGDAGADIFVKRCPTCHTLIKTGSPGSIEKNISGISSISESIDPGRLEAHKTYTDGDYMNKTNFRTE